MNKRAEEATRRTAEEAKQFVEEANRRADEAHRHAKEVIRETKEAKESFVAELEKRRHEEEKRRHEEEKRVKEMAEQVLAAQARAQAAEQQTLEASKIAEEKIQKAAREASKLQETFMKAMKQFNTNPVHTNSVHKKVGQGKQQEWMDSVDSGSEDEVLHSLSQSYDDDEPMSLAPESSEIRVGGEVGSKFKDMKNSQRGSLSNVRLFLRTFNIC